MNVKELYQNLEENLKVAGTAQLERDYEFFNREIYLQDVVEEVAVDVAALIRIYNKMDELEGLNIEDREPIKLYIHSVGGDMFSCFMIIDEIRRSKTPVYTITTGTGYSSGLFIGIHGHKRFGYPLSTYLFHEGQTGFIADAGKFKNFSSFYTTQLEVLKKLTLQATKIDEEKYESMKEKDWWFSAEEALNYGLIDEII